MVKVKIKKTFKGSPNGVVCIEYQEGETYDMPESLADVALQEKWAELVLNKEYQKKVKA
jgi:hypothetical protein